MRQKLIYVAAAGFVIALVGAPIRGAQAPAARQAAPSVPAPITPPKPFVPEGFTPLFNGESLAGWHISKTNHHGTTPDYHVLHGLIVATQRPLGRGGILLTDKKYKNVELYMEVKPDYGCDSGLFFRSNEAGDAYQVTMDYLPGGSIGGIYGEGLEGVGARGGAAAAANPAGADRGRGAAVGASGNAVPAAPSGNRGAAAAPESQVAGGIPLGSRTPQGDAPWMKAWKREDWNKVRVRFAGDVPHITVWLNDQQITDFTDTANHAKDGITEGPIAIQVHGGTRWVPGGFWRWRTIAVKELPANAR
jgi:3-keto-disaccharide hydrolase